MRDEKHIRDIFNNTSLEDESWLEPSHSVFKDIEKAIQADKDRRKIPFLWITGIIIFAVSSIVFYIYSSDIETSNNEFVTNNVDLASTKISDSSFGIKSVSEEGISNKLIATHATSTNQEIINSIKSNKVSELYSKISKSLNNNILSSKATDIKKPVNINQPANRMTNSSLVDSMNHIVQRTIPLVPIQSLDSEIAFFRDLGLNFIYQYPNNDPLLNKDLSFSIGSSISFWNFNLNDNYSSALNPADFNHSGGQSTALDLGIEKRLSKLLSFNANLSFENVSFKSGHNSTVTYNQNEENSDQENEFALGIATPLGGVNSGITIKRELTTNVPQNDLLVNLQNDHSFNNIDFTISAIQHLLSKKCIRLNSELGIGLNHTFGLQNNLSEVDINSSSYSLASINASSNQETIIRTRPHVMLGVQTLFMLTSSIDLQIGYRYKNDITAIYNEGDFSTTLSRHQISISSLFKF